MDVPGYIGDIMQTLREHGYKSYVVGGAVRDSLLGRTPKDYDVVTSATPHEVVDIFAHVVPTGIKHGTVTVVTQHGTCEITTMRRDGVYKDSRHPESVEFTDNIYEDLARRDFTVNAIAWNGEEYIDPFGGQTDMTRKIIRAVGDVDTRFQEDALRMMRAVRFACQLDFTIDTDTASAIKRNAHLTGRVSNERIRDELCKILVTEYASVGVVLLRGSDLLSQILPEMIDNFRPILQMVYYTDSDLITRLAALLFCQSDSESTLKRLKFDNDTIRRVVTLIRELMTYAKPVDKISVKRLMQRVGLQDIYRLYNLQDAHLTYSGRWSAIRTVRYMRSLTNATIDDHYPLYVSDLSINGDDLIAAGFKPGKQIGEVLHGLLERTLYDETLNTREALLSIVRATYPSISTSAAD